MRTIAIDCRFATSGVGLGRYTREIVRRIVELGGARFVLIGPDGPPPWMGTKATYETVHANIGHYSVTEQIVLPQMINRTKADLLFVPHFNVPMGVNMPFVMTMHDLILHAYPNSASVFKRLAYYALMRYAVRRARSLIVVSEYVRGELLGRYGAAVAEKSVVITEGVDESYGPRSQAERESIMQRYGLSKPFFLYVGSAKQHKNVSVLIKAFHIAHPDDMELILVSGGKEATALHPLPSNIRMLQNVPDQDLPALYSAAKAFVTASLYEGYGLPVAEALACGCPVIASDRSAIPEVANGHAMLIEPTVEAFASAFTRSPKATAPYRAGSWDDAAVKTHGILMQ